MRRGAAIAALQTSAHLLPGDQASKAALYESHLIMRLKRPDQLLPKLDKVSLQNCYTLCFASLFISNFTST